MFGTRSTTCRRQRLCVCGLFVEKKQNRCHAPTLRHDLCRHDGLRMMSLAHVRVHFVCPWCDRPAAMLGQGGSCHRCGIDMLSEAGTRAEGVQLRIRSHSGHGH